MSWSEKCHEVSNVMKCWMSRSVKGLEMSKVVKWQMLFYGICHKMSNYLASFLNLSRFLAFFAATFAIFWQILQPFGFFEEFFRICGIFGYFLYPLPTFCNFLGNFCHVLATFAMFWQLWAIFAMFWQPWQFLANPDHRKRLGLKTIGHSMQCWGYAKVGWALWPSDAPPLPPRDPISGGF